MFGLFKRKTPENPLKSVLDQDCLAYALFVEELFENMERGSRAHVLVAYLNLFPTISVMRSYAAEHGEEYSIDEFILGCAHNHEAANDEINTRRHAWFMWAAMIYRITEKCADEDKIRDILAGIWCGIARDSPLLKALLPDNVVWQNDEKAYFDLVLNGPDKEIVAWTINHGGPRVIWPSPVIKSLAEKFDLFHYDSTETMGPLRYIPKCPLP